MSFAGHVSQFNSSVWFRWRLKRQREIGAPLVLQLHSAITVHADCCQSSQKYLLTLIIVSFALLNFFCLLCALFGTCFAKFMQFLLVRGLFCTCFATLLYTWLLIAGMSSELIIPTLAERVLTHSSKRKRLTIASNGQPDELQLTRLHSFVLNSISPSTPATGKWPDQTNWAELALTPLFRESSSIWCKRSDPKSLQNALEKFCVAGSQTRADYSAIEAAWWQRHRKNLVNHVKPWGWCNGNQGYALGIREGITKLLVPAKEIKTIVKRRRLEEYNAHKGDHEYTDGLKTCQRCLHRTVIINTSTCLYGDCESKKKAGAAARKRTSTAAARPEACEVRCTGNGQMKGCGCVVFTLPGAYECIYV